jgi:pimeloyl-ACP methyl ester carboxylesterase
MTGLPDAGTLDLGDQQLEYRFIGPRPGHAPTLVLLHEGLGCVELWGDFPDKLAQATGAGVFVYSRAGYGQSSLVPLPRPLTYMQHEAQRVLPDVLEAIGFRRGLLIGHSDGASIAAIYAGSVADDRVCGVTLIAPHFFTEDMGIAEIAEAKVAYDDPKTELRARLARWHKDVDNAFRGWNGAWLDPDFRKWDLTEFLEPIRSPVQVIQGVDDQYGTAAQVQTVQQLCCVSVDVAMLPGVKHSPHREAADRTVELIAAFAARVLPHREAATSSPD